MRKLRVIFQGGGAKLATLLAAAHSLEEICAKDGYDIVEYGGVSAGSIAAAAMSLPVDHPVLFVREQMVANSSVFDRKARRVLGAGNLLSKSGKPASNSDKILGFLTLRFIWLPISRAVRIAYYSSKVLFGGSLIAEKTLIDTLTKVFSYDDSPHKAAESAPTERSDIRKRKPYVLRDARSLTVFSSLLNEGKSKSYTSKTTGVQPNDDLDLDLGYVLAKSSCMPFVFGGHGVTGAEVDGGISGNLQASYFIDAEEQDIKTLVFVFPEEARPVTGLWSFATALLTSAMASTVREAKIQTTESGGAVCLLPDLLNTFDFPKALESELTLDRFLLVSHELKPRIRQSLSQLFGIGRYKVLRTTKYSRDEVSDIFADIYRRYPVNKQEAHKIMVDRSVRRGLSATHDERCYVDKFVPLNERIEVCQIGLPFNLTAPTPTLGALQTGLVLPQMKNLFIDVNDNNGRSIDSLAYLALSSKDGRPWNRVLIFLKEAVTEYPITVVTRFDGDVFGDYRRRGWDFFSTHADLGMTCHLHRWICVLDEQANLKLSDLSGLGDPHLNEVRPFAKSLDERFKNWSSGVESQRDQVDQLLKSYCRESLEPNMYKKVIAWEAANLLPGVSAGFHFMRASHSTTA